MPALGLLVQFSCVSSFLLFPFIPHRLGKFGIHHDLTCELGPHLVGCVGWYGC